MWTSIIPTTTGAAKALSLVLPAIKRKTSWYGITCTNTKCFFSRSCSGFKRDVTVDEINEAFIEAAENELKGIMEFTMNRLFQ